MSNSKLEVPTPQNSQLLFIDHQPQMAFGVQSIDRQVLKNNVIGLAKAAKVFGIPTTITTVETQSFSGFTYPELLDVFPGQPQNGRTWQPVDGHVRASTCRLDHCREPDRFSRSGALPGGRLDSQRRR